MNKIKDAYLNLKEKLVSGNHDFSKEMHIVKRELENKKMKEKLQGKQIFKLLEMINNQDGELEDLKSILESEKQHRFFLESKMNDDQLQENQLFNLQLNQKLAEDRKKKAAFDKRVSKAAFFFLSSANF
jgi:hypothetical protein